MNPDSPEPPVDSVNDARSGPTRLTAANALTSLRLIAAPVCSCMIVAGRDFEAVLVFFFAIATDFADGPLARKRGESSPFGALLDHATDATFVVLGIGALVMRGFAPVVLPFLIALAFVQYTLDSRALAGEYLRASALGRWNGIFYFVLLGTPIIRNTIGWSWPGDGLIALMGWLLVMSTAVSMADRTVALRRSRRRTTPIH